MLKPISMLPSGPGLYALMHRSHCTIPTLPSPTQTALVHLQDQAWWIPHPSPHIFLNPLDSAWVSQPFQHPKLPSLPSLNTNSKLEPGCCKSICETIWLSHIISNLSTQTYLLPHSTLEQEAHPVPSVHMISFHQRYFQPLDPTVSTSSSSTCFICNKPRTNK